MAEVSIDPAVDAASQAFFEASALLDAMRLGIWDRQGLTVTQLRLLNHLNQQEGLSNAELADRLYVTRPSVSALLERLERGGFIRREVAPNDRRGICIWLEEPGRVAISSSRQEAHEYMAGLMESLSKDELEQLTTSLRDSSRPGGRARQRDLDAERPALG